MSLNSEDLGNSLLPVVSLNNSESSLGVSFFFSMKRCLSWVSFAGQSVPGLVVCIRLMSEVLVWSQHPEHFGALH